MSSKKIFITGAAGFVGAVLTRRLLAEGHEVHVLLKSTSNPWRLTDVISHIHRHEVDIRDEAHMAALAAEVRPEVIYHLAAHGAYPSQTDADGIIQTNILGTWNLLKALAKIDYQVFVNTGSSSEYGFKDYAMRETDFLEPNSYYSVAKCAQTLLCQYVASVEKKPITTFRLFSAYGPFEEPTRLIPTLIRSCLRGADLKLVPPGTARDFVYVEDVVDAYLCLDKLAKLSREIINIGTGVQSTVQQVVDAVIEHTDAHIKCHWGAMSPRIWDSQIWVADCTKSRRLLDWQPRTTLGDGLRQTVEWMRGQS